MKSQKLYTNGVSFAIIISVKIAIDESGDSGRKIWKGSSRWFVVAAVIVPDVGMSCGQVCRDVYEYSQRFMGGSELHFAHNSHDQHTRFFEYVHDKEFVFAAVALDKLQLLRKKPYVLRTKMSLLRYSLEQLFGNLQPWLDNPVVVADTNGSKQFNRALSRHMQRRFGSRHKGDYKAIADFITVDSKSEPLIQLADYVAGAVRHHVDTSYNSHSFEKYLADKGRVFVV